jgi:hypothetical protein
VGWNNKGIHFLSLGFCGWNLVCNFGFQVSAMLNVENYPALQQTLQLHLHCEYVVVWHVWKHYIRQEVGGEWDMMVLIGGVEEHAAVCWTAR